MSWELRNVNCYYPHTFRPAVKNINLTLEPGQLTLLCGPSGCGKSTLAKVIAGLAPQFSGGRLTGRVSREGRVAIVFQDPEKQLLAKTVEYEIACGLENDGVAEDAMSRRVADALNDFHLSSLARREVCRLSGGQQQLTVLAAVEAMTEARGLLILDEPTSQLSPSSAQLLFDELERLLSLGQTILLIEQRMERALPLAGRVLFMSAGELVFNGSRKEFCTWDLQRGGHFLPAAEHLSRRRDLPPSLPYPPPQEGIMSDVLLAAKKLCFTYPGASEPALRDVSFELRRGEIMGLSGHTGSGKSTLLKLLAGILKPDSGSVTAGVHTGYLSQNPNDYLFSDTLRGELAQSLKWRGLKDEGQVDETLNRLGLLSMAGRNPRDLSGGERQRAALAAVLVTDPAVLLLDEPTRGLDRLLKEDLGLWLRRLASGGQTMLVVSHDNEFLATLASRALVLEEGRVLCSGSRQEIFSGDGPCATAVGRRFPGYCILSDLPPVKAGEA